MRCSRRRWRTCRAPMRRRWWWPARASRRPRCRSPLRSAVDPARIDANRRYVVRGRITLNGQLLFTSDTAYPVFGAGDVRRVDNMLLRRVGGVGAAGEARRMRGLYRYLADAASFFDCASGDQFPIVPEGASAALQAATWRPVGAGRAGARHGGRSRGDACGRRRRYAAPMLQVERFVAIAPQSACEASASAPPRRWRTPTGSCVALRGQPVVGGRSAASNRISSCSRPSTACPARAAATASRAATRWPATG